MAHFAELDSRNIVKRVIVVHNNELLDADGNEVEQKGIDFCKSLFGGTWVQTSYNANFRGCFASRGQIYDAEQDIFIPPTILTEEELSQSIVISATDNDNDNDFIFTANDADNDFIVLSNDNDNDFVVTDADTSHTAGDIMFTANDADNDFIVLSGSTAGDNDFVITTNDSDNDFIVLSNDSDNDIVLLDNDSNDVENP